MPRPKPKRHVKKPVIPERCVPFRMSLKKENVFFGSRKWKSIGQFTDGRLISAHSPKDGIAHIGYIHGDEFVPKQFTHVDPDKITKIYPLDYKRTKIKDGKIESYDHFRTVEITDSKGRVIKNVKK